MIRIDDAWQLRGNCDSRPQLYRAAVGQQGIRVLQRSKTAKAVRFYESELRCVESELSVVLCRAFPSVFRVPSRRGA
eukprot:6770061-Prymnesium_polylepis.1